MPQQLPSLSAVRLGAQQLLDWLYREYWQRQVCVVWPLPWPPCDASIFRSLHSILALQAGDLESAARAAAQLVGSYRAVALKVQADCPSALHRACR